MSCTEILVERAASSSKRYVIDDRGMAGYPVEEPSLGCARFRLHFHLYLAYCVLGRSYLTTALGISS